MWSVDPAQTTLESHVCFTELGADNVRLTTATLGSTPLDQPWSIVVLCRAWLLLNIFFSIFFSTCACCTVCCLTFRRSHHAVFRKPFNAKGSYTQGYLLLHSNILFNGRCPGFCPCRCSAHSWTLSQLQSWMPGTSTAWFGNKRGHSLGCG